MDDVEQMMVVQGVYFHEHIVVTGGVVAFHDFRNAFQLLHHLVEVLRMLQVDADEGTRLISYFLRVDVEFLTLQHALVAEFLNALVNSGSAHVADSCHLEERHSCVFRDEFENLLVQRI